MFALIEFDRRSGVFVILSLILICAMSGCQSALIRRGLGYESRGDYNSAVERYKQALDQASDVEEKTAAQRRLGMIYARLGNYSEAAGILHEAKGHLSPEMSAYSDICYALGLSYYEMGRQQWEKSAKEFEQAVEIYEKTPEAEDALIRSYFYLWVISWHQKKYPLAQAYFQKAILMNRHSEDMFIWTIGPAPGERKVEKQGVTVLPFTNLTGDEGLEWLSRGAQERLNLKLGSVDSIDLVESTQLEEVLKQHSLGASDLADRENMLKIGKLIVARKIISGSYQKGGDDILVIGKIIDVETGTITKIVERTGSQENVGNIMDQMGDALMPYIDPNFPHNQANDQFLCGSAYIFKGMEKESIQAFKMALKNMPDWAECHNNLGNVYALASEYEAAISEYKRALESRADWPKACYNLARTYSISDDKTSAREWLKKTIALSEQYISLAIADPAFKDATFRNLIGSQ